MPDSKLKKIFISLSFLFAFSPQLFAGQPAYFAGTFYPAGAKELKENLSKLIPEAESPKKLPQILIVPHAGYDFSGKIAGQAFAQLRGQQIPVVIVLGTAHSKNISGAAIDPQGEFETPLGKIPIDSPSALRLLSLSKKIQADPEAFQKEHSIEVELPFLQTVLPGFKLVPLLMQRPDLAEAKEIGNAIATLLKENEAAGRRTLLVVSTDFAHYPNIENAKLSDESLFPFIEKVNPEGLRAASAAIMNRNIPHLVTTLCGEEGVLAGLYAAKALGISKAEILAAGTSADSPKGEPGRTVGYAAAVFYNSAQALQKAAAESSRIVLSETQKKELLASAKNAVKQFVETGKVHEKIKIEDSVLNKPQAVFVTLYKKGQLRGCIGATFPKYPLKQAVIYYAVAAATQDSRFPPVKKEEVKDLSYEISLLSPQKLIASPEEIIPGKHGVILIQGNHVGVLLPEVWKENKWSKEEFLNALASQKAGLPANAWKNPRTQLYIFTADSFKDH